MIRIGEDFTSSICLDLFPGISIPRGIYGLEIAYTNGIYYSNLTTHINHKHLDIEIGRDVYNIHITLYELGSLQYPDTLLISYSARVDELIILNLLTNLIP